MLSEEAPDQANGQRHSRALWKKEKRKRKRQALAKLREAVNKEEEQEEEKEEEEKAADVEEEDDLQYEIERQRLHEEWLLREQKAQEEFQIKKEKEEAARRREEEERRLIEEWREKEMKENPEHLEKVKKKEREEAVQKMLDEAENQLENGGTWHNPVAPEGYSTERDKVNCPFYLKTGACRFGDRCSRHHNYPSSSQTLLIRNMFLIFGMEQSRRDDYDTDASLEYGDEEIYQQFVEFYHDVLPELKSVGHVIQFKVSCNFEPHLRGNVYVQYQTEDECSQAFSQFNGRWYASRQLQCEFSPVTKWRSAICGLFERQKCPRGKNCNFLHVFRNPNNEFWEADRDLNLSPDRNNPSERWERSSRYGDRGHFRRYRSPNPDRNGESARRNSSNHKNKKHDRSHRSRSRQRERKKHKRKKRSSSRSRSPSKNHRNRSRSRSRGKRSRSRSRSRRSKNRSRSKSRGRKSESRSRSRSLGRGSRSRSRSGSQGRNGRSRSRSRRRNDKKRSRSMGRKSRSGSRGRIGRSRSRSRSRNGKSRSRSGGGKSKSRSRSRSQSSGGEDL